MSNAIKLLVSGFENSGKSTIVSQINDALVINFDRKNYTFATPHADFGQYEGIKSVIDFINSKIAKYKEAKKELPKVIVLDTVTHLYNALCRFNATKYSGFATHNQNNIDVYDLNSYIEKTLLPNGISVVLVAHTIQDDTGITIPAQGQFAKTASWLSVTNEAIFIEKNTGNIILQAQNGKYPARCTLSNIDPKIKMNEFDINKHIQALLNAQTQTNTFKL